MNIAMINTTNALPDRGGIASYTHELAYHLRGKGQNVTVMTYPLREQLFPAQNFRQEYPQVRFASYDFRDITPPAQEEYRLRTDLFLKKVVFYCLVYSRIGHMVWETFRFIKKAMNNSSISPEDRVVLWALTWSPEGIVTALASRLLGFPYVVTAHGMELILAPKGVSGMIYRSVLGHARKIFAVSHHTADILYRGGIANHKVCVIHNGVRAEDFEDTRETGICTRTVIEKYGLHGKRILVTIARLVPRKGHEKVLEALVDVRKIEPDIKYLIIGEGPLKAPLMELVSRWSLEDVVLFTGEISEQEKVRVLHACDLFVMPNQDIPAEGKLDTEGFGIAFLEANACRKPVIGGMAGGAKEAIVDGKTGFLVNPEDPIEIKEAILKILRDGRLASSMGETGRERVLQKFQWSNLAEVYLNELTSL